MPGWRARRRLSLLALLVWMPLYIVVVVSLMAWTEARFGRLPLWAELVAYVGLGLLWILPLRPVFRGVGQADPDAPPHDPARGNEAGGKGSRK